MAKKLEKEFELVNRIIERHWNRAVGLANAESLMTYWTVGAFVSERLKKAQWGSKTVEALCDYLKMRNPKRKGYGKRNVYNMVEFYEAYSSLEFKSVSERLKLHEFVQMPSAQIQDTEVPGDKKGDGIVPLATIVQMPSAQSEYERRYLDSFPMFLTLTTFSNHLEILGRCNSIDEKVLYPGAEFMFKDKVFVDFLRLPERHNERRLHASIREHIKEFILAMGKDFLWMGDEYSIQVGGKWRRLDLLFYHRALRCLVDVELKAVPFEPEFAGKMDFYLAAIDDQLKREDENPSVGIILCPEAGKYEVKYAIDRTMSPMMIAEYKRLLIPEEVMKKSLEEYCTFMKKEEGGLK